LLQEAVIEPLWYLAAIVDYIRLWKPLNKEDSVPRSSAMLKTTVVVLLGLLLTTTGRNESKPTRICCLPLKKKSDFSTLKIKGFASGTCTAPMDPVKALKIFTMSSGHFENNHLFCHNFGAEPLTPRDLSQSENLKMAILNEISKADIKESRVLTVQLV
jgi:hypothetical protein